MRQNSLNVKNPTPPQIQRTTSYRLVSSTYAPPIPDQHTNIISRWKDYGKTGLALGACKALLVPATQPLQVIMRHQQAQLANGMSLNAPMALKEITQSSARSVGIPSALFRGSLSAMTKEAIKNGTYKAVAFKGAPKLVKHYFPSQQTHIHSPLGQHFLISMLASVVASSADTVIGGPFERYATHRATSQGHLSNASFFQELKTKGTVDKQLKFIYKGGSATFIKTGIACMGLFAGAGPIQHRINQAYGLQPGDNIPLSAAGLTAVATGGLVALLSSPFDIVKTILQRPQSADNQSTAQILKNNIQRFGLRGATAGLPIKVAMTIVGWGAVSAITQQSKTVPDENKRLHRFSPA